VKKTKKVACLSEKQEATTTKVPLIRCCFSGMSRLVYASCTQKQGIYRHIRLCKSLYKNIFLRLYILINNINKHIHFLRNTNNLKPKHIIFIGCFNIYEKMSHYSKGKGAQKSSYFNCWASLPSHAFLQLRHGEREKAQKYFLCVLFADPD